MSARDWSDFIGFTITDEAGAVVRLPDGAHDWSTGSLAEPPEDDPPGAVEAWVCADTVEEILAEARALNPDREVSVETALVNVRLSFTAERS